MEFFDTHCHINDKRFTDDLSETVARACEAGVSNLTVVGTNLSTSRRCLEIAREFEAVHAVVGIQPNCAHEAADTDWDEIVKLIDQPEVVAIGETGLDRYWDDCPFPIQEDYFDRHLRLSQERQIPFVVHMRECGDDVLRMLTAARQRCQLHGVMHSFTGDVELMLACVELGMMISFAGMVTFKKSDELRNVAARVPLDHLMIETDAPYLTPEPMRKQRRNEPALVVHTAHCIADARGMAYEELAKATTKNAKQFFGINT